MNYEKIKEQAIADKCDENEPYLDDVEWVEPFKADEDPDPLFDSTRGYVEQIDRFKGHQGKPIARREVSRQVVCAVCDTTFEANHQSAKTCSPACRQKLSRTRQAEYMRARRAEARNTSDLCHAIGDICDGQPEAGGVS